MTSILDRGYRSVRVMIVDNNASSLASRAKIFSTFGCLVIGASSRRDAERELNASPVPDLIVTDIHMPEGDPTETQPYDADRDISGIKLQRYVRLHFPTVPIGCYSAYYTDESLPDDALKGFDFKLKRGTRTPTELEADIEEAVKLGTQHMLRRQAQYDDLLADLRNRHAANEPRGDVFRRLALEGEGQALVEGQLGDAGYRLRLVGTGGALSSKEPIIIWTCPAAGGVETEVYGYGALYAYGPTEDAAIGRLLELMYARRDLLRAAPEDDEHLLAFLERMLP